MRILLNTKLLMCSNRAGIGFYVQNLYGALREAGIDVIPTLDIGSTTLVSSIGNLSARMRAVFGRFYPPFVKPAGDAIYRYLHKRDRKVAKCDLYHETTLDTMPSVKGRSVCNIYDLSFVRFPELFVEGFAVRAKSHASKNISASERVIVNTRFIRDEAVEIMNIDPERIDIISLAASGIYREAPHDATTLRKAVKRFTERDYLLYAGTVEPRKNLKTLIRAYSDVRAKYDVALIIAGGLGWLYDDIISYPEKLGIQKDVIFTDYVDGETLLSLYRAASVFVYPSLYEGFGLPPLEAMACGLPVVLSNIPTLREVCGDAAIYFSPSDYGALAHVIERVLSSGSLRMELKQKGLRKAAEYSWQKVAADTIRTYQKALDN